MAIKYIEDGGNVYHSKLRWIVNPIGLPENEKDKLAVSFQLRFPSMIDYYRQFINNVEFRVGNLGLFDDEDLNMFVIFFPVKEPWEDEPKLESIEVGLSRFRDSYSQWDIWEVAFPKLGAEIKNVDWEQEVKPLFEKYLGDLPIDIEVYL